MSFFNFGFDFSTTPKRPLNAKNPTIPFCTSPSQLQEVTLDQDATFSNTMGIRSPGGPTRGRSVKEIEEQLSNLKKENFNLKLRIYFLEEKMGAHFTLDKDNIVKKYIELQVEFGNLQKELDEKHDLLCQAVKAMELEEEEHKKYVTSKEDQLNVCQRELEDLRMQLQDTKFDSDGISLKSDTTGFYSSRALNNGNLITDLQERVKILETELHLEKENNSSLQFYIGHAETLKTRYENAQKECFAKDATIKNLHDEIEASNSKLSTYSAQLSQMQDKLDNACRENESLAKRIRSDCRKFEELTDQLSELRKKYLSAKTDYERAEKLKLAGQFHAKELEEENRQHKDKIGELRARLETVTAELRKNQNLAVFSSPEQQNSPDAHPRSLSVQDAAAPAGAAQAHPPYVPVAAAHPPIPLLVENEAQKLKLVKLKKEQFKACEIIKNMISSRNKANEEIAQLKRQVKELERELESVVSKPASDKEEASLPSKGEREKSMAKSEAEEEMDIAEHYKALTVELEAKVEILVATLNEKDIQMQNVRKQYDEILTCLEEKDNKLADVEFELLRADNSESSTSFSEKHSMYRNEIEEKNKKIEKLTEELKKCTFYLQEIVNKELWDKNKEIEKLYNKHTNSPDACKVKNELSKREEQIEQLLAKISNLKIDNERSEKQRAESNELCVLLHSRLEELALFLDSLLKHKSVLGFLGLDKEKRLRGLVNSSLDISKSFVNSLMVSGDHTLTQLTNITGLLDVSELRDLSLKEEEITETLSIIPDDVTLTYQSHLYKKDNPDKDAVILALREEIVNLKSELQLRDNELSKLSLVPCRTSDSDGGQKDVSKLFLTPVKCNTTSTTLKYQSECLSESEGWSEPDRVVSRARIGLSRTAPDFLSIAKDRSESTEEESACSLTPTKRSFDKRSSLELNELQEIRMLTDKLALAEARLTKSVDMSLLEELKERLTEAECSLSEARKRKEEAEIKMAVMQRTIEKLNKDKEVLKESVNVKDKEIKDLINTSEAEKEKAKKQVESYERDAIKAKRDIVEKDIKLEELHKEMEVLEANLRSKYEQFAIAKLRSAEEEFLVKIKLSEEKAEDNMRQLQDCYAREYVKKSEVEEKLLQVELLLVEMDKLKTAVSAYEETVQAYKQKNNELGSKLVENQNKLNNLHKELDTTTLQFSEAVLEKTKLASAKNALEQELNRLASRGTELEQLVGLKEHQVADIRTELDKVQKQKSNLEVKLSEMESTNAELHNKLVKMQARRNEFSLSLPKSASRGSNRQYLNGNYDSEDQISFRSNAGQPLAKPLPVFEANRQEANSSPDLGIESDQGRFSSLETHSNNVQRPLLQTIELTESMSNLLDGDGHLENVNYCESDHCCNRSTAFANENSELKRKLLRMRRALDETAAQLALANQRKKQVEKVICKQIHKTSQVLRKAKANLDSGSESDLLDK